MKVGRVILDAPHTAAAWFLRRRVKEGALHFLAFALIASTPLRATLAESVVVENIKITVAIAGETVPHFGFIPVRMIVENRQARDLRWDGTFHVDSFRTGAPDGARWTTSLVWPASRTTERWIYVPSVETGLLNRPGSYGTSGSLTATFEGTGIRSTTLHLGARGAAPMSQMVPWAVSPTLQPVVRAQIAAFQARQAPPPARGGSYPRRPSTSFSIDLATMDVTQTLADWRVWAPYARVVLTDAEYAAMPPPNRVALRNWVALGGWLYLVPTANDPRSRAQPEAESFGAGMIIRKTSPITADTSEPSPLFEANTLLGTTPALPSANDMSLQRSGLSLKMPPAKRVGDWLVYFFVGFALLVGPVNLFGFAPVKRRQRLFLTVPAISLAAVGTLGVAIWLQDGVGGDGARRALVVLLPGDNQAAMFQEQVSRSGLLFGTSFSLAEDTVCASLPTDDPNATGGRAFVYHRQENAAGGDWFRSRARQAQHLRRLTPTRARVEQVATAPDGAPVVQSSFGVTLRHFSLVSSTGTWEAAELRPGARVTLARVAGNSSAARRAVQFGDACSIHFQQLVRACTQAAPGHFTALAEDSDLAPVPTLPGIRWRSSEVLYTGIVEGGTSKASR